MCTIQSWDESYEKVLTRCVSVSQRSRQQSEEKMWSFVSKKEQNNLAA